jgi:quinol-cytochrome oxidoreductase complex cytochrome b subunit
VIFAVVFLHIWALHVTGSNNPLGIDTKGPQDTLPFHPYYTMKDTFGLMAFLIIYALVRVLMPNALGHPDNYIEANPLVTPAHIVPEWYFLPFYAMLRAITFRLRNMRRYPSKVGASKDRSAPLIAPPCSADIKFTAMSARVVMR